MRKPWIHTYFVRLNSYSKNILLKLVASKMNKGSFDLKLGKFDFGTSNLKSSCVIINLNYKKSDIKMRATMGELNYAYLP